MKFMEMWQESLATVCCLGNASPHNNLQLNQVQNILLIYQLSKMLDFITLQLFNSIVATAWITIKKIYKKVCEWKYLKKRTNIMDNKII